MLSVVIPTFNHLDTLPRAIHSACQVRGVREVIIVDDCSQDGTLTYLERICQENSLVRYLRNSENCGPGVSRNIGAENSKGKWLTFLDADDELLNERFLEDALAVMDQNSAIQVVKAPMEFFDAIKGYILPDCDPRYIPVVMSSACATIIPRNLFIRVGGFPVDAEFRGSSGGEDVAFMQGIMQVCGPIGRIESVSYRVFSRPGSHVDQFIAKTRLREGGFEFISKSTEADNALSDAVESFKFKVVNKFNGV